MISQTTTVQVPTQHNPVIVAGAERNNVPHYIQQQNVLTIVRHLGLLLMEAQKHRGTSMAMLEGDAKFESRVLHEQAVIQRLLEVTAQINLQCAEIIPAEKWQRVERDWQDLVQNWSDDTVITNFELHSHFIECILKLVWKLVEAADYFTFPQSRNSTA